MLIEIKCSFCGKFNYDSETGHYGEQHQTDDGEVQRVRLAPCDIKGDVYLDGYLLEVRKMVTITNKESPKYLRGGQIVNINRTHGTVWVLFLDEREPLEFKIEEIQLTVS